MAGLGACGLVPLVGKRFPFQLATQAGNKQEHAIMASLPVAGGCLVCLQASVAPMAQKLGEGSMQPSAFLAATTVGELVKLVQAVKLAS